MTENQPCIKEREIENWKLKIQTPYVTTDLKLNNRLQSGSTQSQREKEKNCYEILVSN